MPIYEFFCPDCSTIFSFLSRTVNTEKIPACPKCSRKVLERKVSLFAAIGKKGEKTGGDEAGGADDPLSKLNLDESKMERAMEALAGEAESINEEDPRAAARLMRKFSDMTGLQFNETIENAVSRLEAGEDPEAIESEMGDMENMEDPFLPAGNKPAPKARRPVVRDDTLYEM
jgi:putative FmdB family regulatory protein